MNRDRIDTLADLAADKIRALILEARDSITESITAIVEDAKQAGEDKTVLAIAPRIAWDLGKNSVVVTLNVTTRRRYECAAYLDDPAQEKLPLVEGDGDAMTEPGAAAARKIVKALREAEARVTAPNPGVRP